MAGSDLPLRRRRSPLPLRRQIRLRHTWKPCYTLPSKNGATGTFTPHTGESRDASAGYSLTTYTTEHKCMPSSAAPPDRPRTADEIFAFIQSAESFLLRDSCAPNVPEHRVNLTTETQPADDIHGDVWYLIYNYNAPVFSLILIAFRWCPTRKNARPPLLGVPRPHRARRRSALI